jgi:hypothetical protein
MPRIAQISPKECVYHILTRGNNRQDVFKDEKDYEKYKEILQRYKDMKENRTVPFFSSRMGDRGMTKVATVGVVDRGEASKIYITY